MKRRKYNHELLTFSVLMILLMLVIAGALALVAEIQDGAYSQSLDALATQIGAWMSTPNIPGVKVK